MRLASASGWLIDCWVGGCRHFWNKAIVDIILRPPTSDDLFSLTFRLVLSHLNVALISTETFPQNREK